MPSDTTQVTALLVPVARDLEVRAGDQLMIVAGVCVGIYSGEQKKPAAQALLTALPPPKVDGEKPPKKKAAGQRGADRFARASHLEATNQRLAALGHVTRHPGASSLDVAAKLDVTSARARQLLKQLVAQGSIVMVGRAGLTGITKTYRRADPPAANGAATEAAAGPI
jgi:hypothetical protein